MLLVGSLVSSDHHASMTQMTTLMNDLAALQRETERQRRRITELHEAERHAREIAERALKMRDFMLATVSHDLLTPVTAIMGTAQLLRRRIDRGQADWSHQAQRLEQIEATATTLRAMIDQLLDAARVQMGEPLRLHREPTDLVTLMRERVDVVQQMTQRQQVTLVIEAEPLVGMWDRGRLLRVVDNLLANAVKYSPAGEEVLVIVGQMDDAAGPSAIVTVHDRGIGIPASDLPMIFEPFHRAGNVEQIQGTGMGLASAKWIVEQHGGAITVTSTIGEGSTFTVRLPLDMT